MMERQKEANEAIMKKLDLTDDQKATGRGHFCCVNGNAPGRLWTP